MIQYISNTDHYKEYYASHAIFQFRAVPEKQSTLVPKVQNSYIRSILLLYTR